MNKHLNDWLDEAEGLPVGTSNRNIEKEMVRQGVPLSEEAKEIIRPEWDKMKEFIGRQEAIKKYGRDVVEYDEKTWAGRGYRINYATGLLERLSKAI